VLAGFEVVDYFVEHDKAVPGYTSLAVLLLVLAGFIIFSVGIVGLYVGRIFEQVKNRPLFLIDAEADGPEPAWTRATVSERTEAIAPAQPPAAST